MLLMTFSHLWLLTEPDGVQRRAFAALAVILSLLSIAFLVFEMWIMRFKYLMQDLLGYFADYETIIRVGVFLLTIIFVFGFWNDCWCAPPWQWQIGALAIFLAYINFILIFKRVPWFGVYINMLFNIIIVFLKLIYLPVFLIFSFAIPFYMLFVRDSHAVLVSVICKHISSAVNTLEFVVIDAYKIYTIPMLGCSG